MRFDRIGTEVSGYDYFVFRLWNTLTPSFGLRPLK
jgi:DNA-binding protein H-NS